MIDSCSFAEKSFLTSVTIPIVWRQTLIAFLCFLLLKGHILINSIHFTGLSSLAEKDRVVIVQPVLTIQFGLK